jgi:Bacterial Ig domain/PASTA domain
MLRPTTDRTRTRARHRRARGAFLRLEVLALVVVAICLAVLSSSSTPARADLELTSGGDSLALLNDKEGAAAVLSLGEMRPGDSVTDTVTLGNTGTVPGDLSLSTSNLLDTPGAGGGALSGKLDLVIRDVTNTGSPLTVFSGKIGALTPFALGTLAAGASRVYEFRVSFPDAGAGAENAFQGSAVSIQFDWTAVNNDADTDPPETTITAGPTSLSAGRDATFAFSSDESGSTFECSLDGSPFAACSSPAVYTGLGDGEHTFDVRATDSSANTEATPAGASWTIDATAPNVSLADPGSPLRGATVTLNATGTDTGGSGVLNVKIQRAPTGGSTWTDICTDNSSPYSCTWNATLVTDGGYDLRAQATDNAGNTAYSTLQTVTVDNTAPALVSSTPADGELVAVAGSLTLVADENLAAVDATIDGLAAPAPLVAGATVTFASTFDDGPHTLAGELEDLAGNRTPVLIHFTVWNLAAADYPWVEKNSFATLSMTLPATNGDAGISVPAGAWSGAPAGDWLVVRIDPRVPTSVGGGFQIASEIYDVTAYWALAETRVHSFDKPLNLTIDAAGIVVPATFESGAWRAIAPIPSGQTLPSGWQDGFYRSGSEVHILTKHLSSFSLLKDVQSPTKPSSFSGSRANGRLMLKWKSATDNGVVSAYLVYANGKVVRTLGASARSVDMGPFKSSDSRSFQVAARDSAGNVGTKTRTLVIVPSVANLPVSQAKTRLAGRGLRAGAVRYAYSATIGAGRVISSRSGLAFKGAAIGLTVSRGPSARYSSAIPTGTSGGTGSGGTSYGGGSYGGTPTPSPSPAAGPFDSGSDSGSLAPSEPGDSGGVGEVEPQSYTPADDETTSPLRRLLGLLLLGGAFVTAGAVALRARRLPRPPQSGETVEPLLFWDDRLVHAVTTSVRRFTGRF